MLDYVLGQLDGPRREQLEREIARDPCLAEKLARLSRRLRRILDDGGPVEPPAPREDDVARD